MNSSFARHCRSDKILACFATILITTLLLVGFAPRAYADSSVGLNVESHTQDDIRAYLKQSGADVDLETEWSKYPSFKSPYDEGKLSDATERNALAILNLIRYIAGIDHDIVLNNEYCKEAQAGAFVNSVNDTLSHYPERPSDMNDDLYSLGYKGASSSNIAYGYYDFGDAITNGWMSDSDSNNIDTLGHRRWCLSLRMSSVGFGMAKKGYSYYSAMYATDLSRPSSSYSRVAWPAQNMPIDYFAFDDPWSITTGHTEEKSNIKVTLTRRSDNKAWTFSEASSNGDFYVDNGTYGCLQGMGCIIFRPTGIGSYSDGDVFDVAIMGTSAGTIKYTVNFFSIKKDIKSAQISSLEDQEYSGNAWEPIKVELEGRPLKLGVDYGVEYFDNVNAGTATVTITGIGDYTGELTKNFKIKPKSIASVSIPHISSKTYTGNAITPIIVMDGKTTLKKGVDYEVSYENNINVGTATAKIKGVGNYSGEVKKEFQITPKHLNETSITVPNKTYTGSVVKPVSIKDVNKTLKEGVDYTVQYINNTGAGTAKAVITGQGNYMGQIEKSFTIKPTSLSRAKVSIKTQTYTGKNLKPKATVKLGSKTLDPKNDYTITYNKKNNVKAGKATVTIKGKGNYSGSVNASFNIAPAKVTGVKTSSTSKGKVTVKWSNTKGKAANATGYKIVVKSGSKTIKTQYVTGKSAKSKTISLANKYKGKKVKTYVYAYKTIGKTKVCSPTSSASTVKVKK